MKLMIQMLIFSILILVGVYARKKEVINRQNIPQLTALVFNYAMPAIILTGVLENEPKVSGTELAHTFLIVFVSLGLLILCSLTIARVLKFKPEERGAIIVLTAFTNIYEGHPDGLLTLYGHQAMIYMTGILLPYNLLFFSLGYYWMSADPNKSLLDLSTLKKLFNPGIVSCVSALAIYLFDIPIPTFVAEPIRMLG